MSVTVRPMTAAEYERWLPRSQEGYAADMIASGVDATYAREKAGKDFAALLPQGVESDGQDLFSVEEDGKLAGSLWLAERSADGGESLFVYEVHVEKTHRGRGVGRAAMLFAEEEARRRGLPRVSLNVFGSNNVARGLYNSLGYSELAVFMVKDL